MTPLSKGTGLRTGANRRSTMSGFITKTAAGIADDTVVLFSADHGGSEKGHGDGRLDHMEVPFLIYGAGVKAGGIRSVIHIQGKYDPLPFKLSEKYKLL